MFRLRGNPIAVALSALLLVPATLLSAQDMHTPDRVAPVSSHFRLLPESAFEVYADRAGLFSFFGHNHMAVARDFEGEIVYMPEDPTASSVRISVLASAVQDVTPTADSSTLATIQRDLQAKVLRPDEYPTIEFVSTAVRADGDHWVVVGDLSLTGTTREVEFDMELREEDGRLRATGEFKIKLRDYGIDPPSAAGGTVKTKDEVRFRIDAVAERIPSGG